MDKYDDFVTQLPDAVRQETEAYMLSDVALFRPKAYITQPLHSVDYHFVISSAPPPDSYVNGRLVHLDPGKIMTVNPGDVIYCVKERPCKPFLSMLIKPELMGKIAREMGCKEEVQFLKLQNPFSGELLRAIQCLDKESMRPDCLRLMMDCLSIQIITQVLREFKTNLKQVPARSPDSDVYIALAIEYMRVFYCANISIGDICGEINLSPFHFIRVFKKKTGVSPHQYLLGIRMEKAQELLRLGQHSVAEVAVLCGFVSLPHFSSAYKTITGNTPARYKKQFIEIQNGNF